MRKGDRIVARHIFAILEQYKGTALRFCDTKREMMKHDWMHADWAILANFTYLVEQGKIVRFDRLYGIPTIRPDGTAYLKIWNSTATIELGKLKQNGE